MLSASFAALICAASATNVAAQSGGGKPSAYRCRRYRRRGHRREGSGGRRWVIAETRDLPTKYVKIVATDDRGRYVLPDMPKRTYDIWVRGYGLVDSPKVKVDAGQEPRPQVGAGAEPRRAAQYYPGIWWYAMMKIPRRTCSLERAARQRHVRP
jgi:hypothetical protein